jgi:hypothetical protein
MTPQPQLTDEELDKKLERIFAEHQGKDKAIKRWDLVVAVFGQGSDIPRTDANSHDREIRDAVERLRNHGWLILNLNDGRGRWLCASEQEYWEFRSVFVKQVKSIASSIRSMDKTAKHKYPNLLQPSLFNFEELPELETA